jgi:hypothetical protein
MADSTLRERLDAVMEILIEAATKGERCPMNDDILRRLEKRGIRCGESHVPNLAERGLIRIEISGRNYRTIEILQGPHKGARTLSNGDTPHLIIDRAGSRRIRRNRPAAETG